MRRRRHAVLFKGYSPFGPLTRQHKWYHPPTSLLTRANLGITLSFQASMLAILAILPVIGADVYYKTPSPISLNFHRSEPSFFVNYRPMISAGYVPLVFTDATLQTSLTTYKTTLCPTILAIIDAKSIRPAVLEVIKKLSIAKFYSENKFSVLLTRTK